MRAVQIVDLSGPESALAQADVQEPEPSHMLTPGSGVVVDVHAAGVSFPEVLQTRGEYQVKPPLPFVPGSEVAGVVRAASDDADVKEGDRVAACCMLGAFAEVAVAPDFLTFRLPDELDYAQGAGLILNYHTALFSLKHRGRVAEARERLMAIPGIGRWTADYVAMRALGDPDVWLPSDVGIRHALARLAGTPDLERLRPWRSYAVLHLWRSLEC